MKRSFLQHIITGTSMICGAGQLTATETAVNRPNVILIMADDLGYEAISAYGSHAYRTPTLDRLAQEGVVFKYCFATPLCTPTRVSLMTGKYNHRNYRRFGYFPKSDETHTIGNLMKQAGYATCMAGKWHVKGVRAKKMGFDRSLRVDCWAGYWSKGNIWMDDRKQPADKSGPYRYRPDITNEFILNFIETNRDRPFFVYYPMFLPHHPEEPTPDHPDREVVERLRKTGKWEGKADVFPEMVTYMDKLIGRVVRKLEELEIRDRTVIMFLGDNGTCVHKVEINGRIVGGGKGSMKDNGTRVPLIVSGPGVLKGRMIDALTDITDFYPTLAEIAGLKGPFDVDG
ncbi:MAG: arylsulfatase, partial [Lentisphaerae bacterium]